MRLYVATTEPALRALLEQGSLPATRAHAVTTALRAAYREWGHAEDEEELEFGAAGAAEEASLDLLAADRALPARRVVLACEQGARELAPSADDAADPTLVELPDGVAWSDVVAVHLDDLAATDVVAEARTAPREMASRLLEDTALSWYLPGEVPEVLAQR